MKQIINYFIKYKIILITLLVLLYGLILRLEIPYQIPIHENNHGIFFINELYRLNHSLDFIISHYLFIKDEFIEQMNYGLIPKLFYGFLLKNVGFSYNIIFLFQIIFSLLTSLFISLSVYKISGKKILYYIVLILGIILPYNIKYSSTDEFIIMGNFFISISLFFYILFLVKQKYSYLYIGLLFFILSIYTRNLYLLFGIFYIVLFFNFYLKDKFDNRKLIINTLFSGLIFFIFSLSRIKVFLFTKDKNFHFPFLNFSGYLNSELTPYLYLFFLILGIFLPIYFFRKNNFSFRHKFLYYFSMFYLFFLLFLLLNTINTPLLQERLQNLFVPFFVILSGVGLYFLMIKIKYKTLILIALLFMPFFYIGQLKELFSPFDEYLFIKQNVNKLGNNFNLVILGFTDQSVFNNFPEFLIYKKNYNIYGMTGGDNRYIDYNSLSDSSKKFNNSFYILSYDCYRGDNIGSNMRIECENIEKNYKLLVVAEKYIDNKPYIFDNSSNAKKLRIGIYKIIGKKND